MIFIAITTSRKNINVLMTNLSFINSSVEEVDTKYIYFNKKGGNQSKIVAVNCLVIIDSKCVRNKELLPLIPFCL